MLLKHSPENPEHQMTRKTNKHKAYTEKLNWVEQEYWNFVAKLGTKFCLPLQQKRRKKKEGRSRERGEGVQEFFDGDKETGDERRCRRWLEKGAASLGSLDFYVEE
ncbi:hypothetical protein J1N35_037757 [Gossypium stocksii]|uniref:Uncharacterized protein n=1 Tax=Gossypium stocksii TaxID=47602 RepID=A0A9D3UKW2_9ROSI|nr:hypothetical protein J1N35_037757 [Gossypium stocksii]